MSKQIRMTCRVLDMLRDGQRLSPVPLALDLEYDEVSVRQMLRVLCELGWARDAGQDEFHAKPGSKPRVFVAGPKMQGGDHRV